MNELKGIYVVTFRGSEDELEGIFVVTPDGEAVHEVDGMLVVTSYGGSVHELEVMSVVTLGVSVDELEGMLVGMLVVARDGQVRNFMIILTNEPPDLISYSTSNRD